MASASLSSAVPSPSSLSVRSRSTSLTRSPSASSQACFDAWLGLGVQDAPGRLFLNIESRLRLPNTTVQSMRPMTAHIRPKTFAKTSHQSRLTSKSRNDVWRGGNPTRSSLTQTWPENMFKHAQPYLSMRMPFSNVDDRLEVVGNKKFKV